MTQIYATKAQLARMTGRNWNTVNRRVKEMKALIPFGIYEFDRDFVGKLIRIDAYQYHLAYVQGKLPDLTNVKPFKPFQP